MATAKTTKTASELAATLAPTDHPADTVWSLKADGQVLHPNDPAPADTAHIELVDVTDHPWHTPPDDQPNPDQ